MHPSWQFAGHKVTGWFRHAEGVPSTAGAEYRKRLSGLLGQPGPLKEIPEANLSGANPDAAPLEAKAQQTVTVRGRISPDNPKWHLAHQGRSGLARARMGLHIPSLSQSPLSGYRPSLWRSCVLSSGQAQTQLCGGGRKTLSPLEGAPWLPRCDRPARCSVLETARQAKTGDRFLIRFCKSGLNQHTVFRGNIRLRVEL